MKKFLSHSIAETNSIATEIIAKLASTSNGRNEATIIGLSGHLGSGKTAFVKEAAKIFGIKEEITSPTFVIMKTYDISSSGVPWKNLIHIDAYRLENGRQLEVLGFEKLVSDPKNIIMIEWIEQVKEIMPADYSQISFEDIDGNKAISWE